MPRANGAAADIARAPAGPAVGRAVIRNAAAILVAQGANLVLPLVTFPYLIRTLGPDQFGVFAFSQAVVSYLAILTDYGFNLSATRRVAELHQERRDLSEYFWSVQGAKSMLALLSGIAIVVVAFGVPRFAEMRGVLFASFPVVVGSVLFPQWLFQGVERMALASTCLVIARLATIVAIFALVHGPTDTWVAAAITSAALVVAGAVAALIIRKQQLVRWRSPSRAGMWSALRDGRHVFASTAAISLYTSTNGVVLGFVADNRAVGVFAAVDKIRLVCQGVLTPLSSAAYPRVNALMHEDRTKAFRLIRVLLLVQAGMTLVISLSLFWLAPLIVRLVMGDAYGSAVIVLRVMAALPFVISFSNVLGLQAMLPLGLDRQFSRILIASGVMNFVLLVPLGMHLKETGAAIAVLATETLVSILIAITLWLNGVRLWQERGGNL